MSQVNVEQKETGLSIVFLDELTIYSANEVFSVLSGIENFSQKVAIDLGGLEELDTAGIQIIELLKRTVEKQQGELVFSHSNEMVDQRFSLFGLKLNLSTSENS